MHSVTERVPAGPVPPARFWVVELNIPGCQIRRWARKRRHLIGLGR